MEEDITEVTTEDITETIVEEEGEGVEDITEVMEVEEEVHNSKHMAQALRLLMGECSNRSFHPRCRTTGLHSSSGLTDCYASEMPTRRQNRCGSPDSHPSGNTHLVQSLYQSRCSLW